jgi:tetratricopeptide (TPR) repeat protein
VKALRLRPASPEAGFQIGALDAATGKLEEARNEFEELERAWPDFLEVHVQLASIYSRLKLREQSQREQKMVLELNDKSRDKKPRP